MKVYDKAAWHIDGGEDPVAVVNRFKVIFDFLAEKKLLSEEGEEEFEFGIDSSASLNSSLVNKEGEDFLDHCYEEVIRLDSKRTKENLANAYDRYKADAGAAMR